VDAIRTGRNGGHFNTLEKYHIYRIGSNNLHMNETTPYFRPYTTLQETAAQTPPEKIFKREQSH
jgi:hypothetical protein